MWIPIYNSLNFRILNFSLGRVEILSLNYYLLPFGYESIDRLHEIYFIKQAYITLNSGTAIA